MENALTNATSQTNFTGLDWGIVVIYLLLSVAVAFFVKRYAGNMTNFVGAGRAVGPCSQSRHLAKQRASVVLPVPRGPAKR